MLFLNEDTKYIAKNDSNWGTVDQSVYDMDLLVESMGIPDGFYENYFSDDPIVMGYEILAETNSSWDALERDMLLCEAHAVIQGIPLDEGFSDTIKKWWEKIKSFFANIWAGIKDFFRKIWVAISSRFQKVNVWWKTHRDEIPDNASVTKKGYPVYKDFLVGSRGIQTLLSREVKDPADSKEAYTKAYEDLEKNENLSKDKLRALANGSENEVDLNITKAVCESVLSKGESGASKELSMFQNLISGNVQNAIKTADEGLKNAKPEDNEKLTAKIRFLKKKQAIYTEVTTLLSSGISKSVSFIFGCAKSMYLEAKRSPRS